MTSCRLITAIALLMHSVLGCGLHHVSACGSHRHEAVAEHAHERDGHADHGHDHHGHDHHSHDHHSCDHGAADQHSEGEAVDSSGYIAPPSCCQFGPCDEGESSCHSELECSYRSSSDLKFLLDSGPVTFITGQQIRAFRLPLCEARDTALGAFGARSHCALLCTWQI